MNNITHAEHILHRLRQVFKKQDYKPQDDIKDILYLEGQQAVIRFIEKEFNNKGRK